MLLHLLWAKQGKNKPQIVTKKNTLRFAWLAGQQNPLFFANIWVIM